MSEGGSITYPAVRDGRAIAGTVPAIAPPVSTERHVPASQLAHKLREDGTRVV